MKQIFAAHFRLYLFGGIIFGFLSGCKVIDPAEDIPSYLHIDAMSLSAVGNQGSSTSAISDAWVFMDGQLIGAFELPCNIPILAEGSHEFIIRGGVKMNGLSTTRAIYPTWKGWEGSVTLTRGQRVSVVPVVTYFPLTDFTNTFMENFDGAGVSLVTEASSQAIIVKDTIPYSFEGPHSGYIHLNNTDTTLFLASSSQAFNMPAAKDTWMEFNYWCDAAFTVGIEEQNNPNNRVAWAAVGASWGWKKIYIRLTDALASATQNVNYKIYFAMQNPSTQSESHLYLDNIKLLK